MQSSAAHDLIIKADLHRDSGGVRVECALLSGGGTTIIHLQNHDTVTGLRSSVAQWYYDRERIDPDVCQTFGGGDVPQILDSELQLAEALENGYHQLTLKFEVLGAWVEGARKFLKAMAVEAFHPKSKAFDVEWTLERARPVTWEEENTVKPLLERLGVSRDMAFKFMRVFWRLAWPYEGWDRMNLQLQQDFRGWKTMKHAFCQHWLQLARDSITERVPRRPGPVILPITNERASVIGVELFGVDGRFPDNFDGNLTEVLRLSDVCPRSDVKALMRIAASLDLDLNPSRPVGEMMKELGKGQDLQLDPLPGPEDVVRMAHVLQRLSCELPVVEVEGNLHRPLLQRVAMLRRWHLKVLHFSAGNRFISELDCVDCCAETGDLSHHVRALRAEQQEQQESRLQGGLMLVHLPINHLGDVGDVCRKLSQSAPVRFIICIQEGRDLVEVLSMKSAVYGEGARQTVAETLYELGVACMEKGDLPAAERHLKEALSINRAVFGEAPNHEVAVTLHELGLLFKQKGDLRAAEQHLAEALGMTRAVFGEAPNHEVAVTLRELGLLFKEKGELRAAEQHLTEALGMTCAVFGDAPNHEVAVTLRELGLLFKEKGDLRAAEQHLTEALDMTRAVFGDAPNHEVAATLHEQGLLFKEKGDLRAAEQHLTEALDMTRAVFGDARNHEVAATLHELGLLFKEKADLPEEVIKEGEEGEADLVCFNGLSGPISHMNKMKLRNASSCLAGVRMHFHELKDMSFFAVRVFLSGTETKVIPRDKTYDELNAPEEFFVIFAILETDSANAKELFAAAEAQAEDVLRLEEELERVDANVQDARGETAACKACRNGHVKMLQSLQLAKADFTLADTQGATPLFLACQEGHVPCARFVLDLCGGKIVCISPADEQPQRFESFVDRPLNSEATSLYVAAQNGHRETVQLLIECRAKVNKATRDKATPLFIASQMGFEGIVDDLIKAKAEVDIPNNTGATPLFISAQNARFSIAKKLIDLKADVNSETTGGATPMYIAAQKNNKNEAELLFNNAADVNKQAQDGATPLLIAAQNGNLATVKFLLSLKVVEKDRCMNSGASPLFVSAQNDHLTVVKTLIEFRSDVKKCLRSGVSPVYIAAQNGNLDVLKYLLQDLGDEHRDLLDKPAVGDATPLFIASQNGHRGVVALLLQMRAQYKPTEDLSSPLLVAAQNGHLQVVEILWEMLKEDAGLNMSKRGGATPLYIACQNGHLDVVKKLIDLEAEVNKCLDTHETPLFIACQGGYLDVVTVLMEKKADVDKAKQDGASPLYIACQNGHVEVVRYLLVVSTRKPDKNQANTNQATPLFIASQKGHQIIVELLLHDPAAEVDKALKSGATPFYIAALKGHPGVLQRLREAGAALNSTPKHGATPVSAAVQNGHLEVLQLLFEMRADLGKPNAEGMSPLHYAAQGGKVDMARLLVKERADPSVRSNNGKTPLDLARTAAKPDATADEVSPRAQAANLHAMQQVLGGAG